MKLTEAEQPKCKCKGYECEDNINGRLILHKGEYFQNYRKIADCRIRNKKSILQILLNK